MTEEQKAGTTAGGNAATAATGTTAGGNAELEAAQKRIEKLESEKQQHLAEKSKAEANARRVAELEAHLTRPANGQPPSPARLQAMIAEDLALEAQGDEGAMYRMALAREAAKGQMAMAEVANLKQLISIPESDRARVEELSREHGVTPAVANKILLGERYVESDARVKAREAEILAQTEKKPVATAAIGLTAAQTADKTMKRSDFIAEVRRLESEGKEKEADALVRREDSGDLHVIPG